MRKVSSMAKLQLEHCFRPIFGYVIVWIFDKKSMDSIIQNLSYFNSGCLEIGSLRDIECFPGCSLFGDVKQDNVVFQNLAMNLNNSSMVRSDEAKSVLI